MLLRDDQWDRLQGLLAGQATHPGRTAADNRVFVAAVLWILRTGAPWRDLPDAFGKWNSVYRRFARWQVCGVWDTVCSALAPDADFEAIFIDRSVMRVPQHGTGAAKKTAPQRSGARTVAGGLRSTRSSMPSATRCEAA